MRFVTLDEVKERFRGKSVAIVGSAPSCLANKKGFIDSHDIVVRINNYKIKGFESKVGERTDVFYSFFGTSIRKTRDELIQDGVTLCLCKCPNSKPIESEWHRQKGKIGTDFRYIYRLREDFWFCDTYIPDSKRFLEHFNVLNRHIPSTGFSCVLDILSFDCDVYLTGFDFFRSKIHNVNEDWNPGCPDDPIRHSPENELKWLKTHYQQRNVRLDKHLKKLMA
mgnify:FL=1